MFWNKPKVAPLFVRVQKEVQQLHEEILNYENEVIILSNRINGLRSKRDHMKSWLDQDGVQPTTDAAQ